MDDIPLLELDRKSPMISGQSTPPDKNDDGDKLCFEGDCQNSVDENIYFNSGEPSGLPPVDDNLEQFLQNTEDGSLDETQEDAYDCLLDDDSYMDSALNGSLQTQDAPIGDIDPVTCDICSEIFNDHEQLMNHICNLADVSRDSQLEPTSDNEVIQEPSTPIERRGRRRKLLDPATISLQDSTPTSTGLSKLPCSSCKRLFKNLVTLKRHEATHIEEFPCALCARIFPRQILLTSHTRRSHDRETDKGAVSEGSASAKFIRSRKCKSGIIYDDLDLIPTSSSRRSAGNNGRTRNSPRYNNCARRSAGSHASRKPIKKEMRESRDDADDANWSGSSTPQISPVARAVKNKNFARQTSTAPASNIIFHTDPMYQVIGDVAAGNTDDLFLVWCEMFEKDMSTLVALNSGNCILFIKNMNLNHGIQYLSDLGRRFGMDTANVLVDASSVIAIHQLVAFGDLKIPSEIANGTFSSYKELEDNMMKYSNGLSKNLVHVVRYEENGLYSMIKDQLSSTLFSTNKLDRIV